MTTALKVGEVIEYTLSNGAKGKSKVLHADGVAVRLQSWSAHDDTSEFIYPWSSFFQIRMVRAAPIGHDGEDGS